MAVPYARRFKRTGAQYIAKTPASRGGFLILAYPSIMMTFFSGSFFSSFFGMHRLSTPCSSFAVMSASVSASPT